MTKQSKHNLIRLLESAVSEVGRFADRGVWLCVNELEATGQPIKHIRAWATLHFLKVGSPFDSLDADLWVRPLREETEEWLQRQLGLLQPVELEWAGVSGVVHSDVRSFGDGGHRATLNSINDIHRARVAALLFELIAEVGLDIEQPGRRALELNPPQDVDECTDAVLSIEYKGEPVRPALREQVRARVLKYFNDARRDNGS